MITKQTFKDYAWAIASVIIILSLSYMAFNHNREIKEKDNLIEALNDTIVITRDSQGKSYAEIQTLRTAKIKDFLNIKSKDAEITRLQGTVKKYEDEIKNGGSVTNFDIVTNIETKGQTVVTPGDTIKLPGGIVEVYPVYSYDYTLKGPDERVWITGSTVSDRFNTTVESKVYNEFSVIIGEESTGFLKPKKPFALVTSANPYSETLQMRTYQVTPAPHKPWAISAVGAYGVGLLDFKPQPFIGAGVTWTPKFARF